MWPQGMTQARLGTEVALAFPVTDPEPHDSQAFCPRSRRDLWGGKGWQRAQPVKVAVEGRKMQRDWLGQGSWQKILSWVFPLLLPKDEPG